MTAQASTQTTDNVNSDLLQRAMRALLKHHEASNEDSNQLLGTDLAIQVQIGLDLVPQRPSPKPIRVSIPHPLHGADEGNSDEPEVCLIVKEESKEWCQEMISKFPEQMGCVKKVLGLQSLRKKHGRYDQKRELLSKYDLFMADDRILPMLCKSLGKNFFETKKQPIPVRLTRKEALPLAIQNCLRSTYMFMSAGTCLTIRAGTTSMPISDLVDNVNAIAKNAVQKIPRKWANVRNIAVKTTDSMSLPIYNKTPEELVEIAKMAGVSTKEGEPEESSKQKEKQREDEQKKRKQELSAKSPLIRALKKQKKAEETPKEKKGAKRKENKEVTTEQPKKKEKKGMTGEKEKKKKEPKVVETPEKVVPKSEPKRSTRSAKKVAEVKEDVTNEASPFIKAKKFSGSKKGYVFKKGETGIGYYVDVKPVIDKMKLAALSRLASTPGRSGRKSPGVKRSKSRGRR